MKRILCVLFCLLFIFFVCGCEDPGEFHEASSGDVDVTVSEEPSSSQTTVISSPILGKWTLVSITRGKGTTRYINSSYDFRESGTLKVTLDKQEQFMKYSVTGNVITIIDGATYNTVSYQLQGDVLTLTTSSGATQRLERMK